MALHFFFFEESLMFIFFNCLFINIFERIVFEIGIVNFHLINLHIFRGQDGRLITKCT